MQWLIGTAAWSVPSLVSEFFPAEGSHLQRYSKVFSAVEINTSFYREHQAKTYVRWHSDVPEDFRFSVKLWQKFTHDDKLLVDEKELKVSLDNISHLENKWAGLLVQLPPSLRFNREQSRAFFTLLTKHSKAAIAFEPRHITWTSAAAYDVLKEFGISKVIADPERCEMDLKKVCELSSLLYYRLHGSPEIYKSEYGQVYINNLKNELSSLPSDKKIWCIFDNTTFGFATRDALRLNQGLQHVKNPQREPSAAHF